MVECPPVVTRQTFCGTVHRTISAGFWHTIVACADVHYKIMNKSTLSVCCICAYESATRTNTLGSVVANRPAGVTRYAHSRAVHRTVRADWRNAVLTCAGIHCGDGTHRKHDYHNFCVCSAMQNCTHVLIHFAPSPLIIQPMLHDAHLTAPLTGQAAPVCPTPLLHVHMFTGKFLTHKSTM